MICHGKNGLLNIIYIFLNANAERNYKVSSSWYKMEMDIPRHDRKKNVFGETCLL